MPQGKGTYGSKVGRPPKKMMGGGMMRKKIKGYKAGGSVSRGQYPVQTQKGKGKKGGWGKWKSKWKKNKKEN